MNTIFETSTEHKSTFGNSNQFPFTNDQIEQLLRLLKSPHDSNLPLCSFPYQGSYGSSFLSIHNMEPWIIDSVATYHMTSFFFTCSILIAHMQETK